MDIQADHVCTFLAEGRSQCSRPKSGIWKKFGKKSKFWLEGATKLDVAYACKGWSSVSSVAKHVSKILTPNFQEMLWMACKCTETFAVQIAAHWLEQAAAHW